MNSVFVFPGQGSQSVGMLTDLAYKYPIILKKYFEANEIIGYDIWDIVANGSKDKLDSTVNTQLAMLIADIAIFQAFKTLNTDIKIKAMAGHSLGEYAALCCAEAIDFEQVIKLVLARANLMSRQAQLESGAMAAIIGLDLQAVSNLCHQASQANNIVAPANINSTTQIVIAGHKNAVETAILLAEQNGAKLAKFIPVNAPCHCMLLQPIAQEFKLELLKVNWRMPVLPVIANVTAKEYNSVVNIIDLLSQQLYQPVQWLDIITNFSADIEYIYECGPANVLTGLNKRIRRDIKSISLLSIL
jgi:[acyl-carrier-protein] S-malonyltransferase